MTDPAEETDTSSAFDALLREAARQSHVSGGPLLHTGKKLADGRLEIVRRIGEGGMGVVYEAFDSVRRERVALKTMSRLEPADVYRLKNEFRALADVSHPNLVRLHELCADGALWCFTMELVQGERFDRWVRPRERDGSLEEARLRSALPELIEAVSAIHAAGKLHRDLKPSNVLVSAEGRVVVLDFGLAIDPEAGGVGQTLADDNLSGTPGYMAPEQAAGRAATAASDFYALGAMLFEVLTGRLPFEGSSHAILVDKQRADAPRASRFAPDAPADLDELCAQLLSRDPQMRPVGATLRAQFPLPKDDRSASRSLVRSSGSEGGASPALEPAPELLGRDAELAALGEAFEATLRGQALVVFVSGESGMGKSALCEAFLHELRREGRATVLSGRCYERENVPFKGFDSLVDDLSRHLRRLPRDEAAAVLPREAYALTQLFPVLGRVPVVAEAPKKDVPEPLELRRRAYAAFGELLARMRDRAPLCVHLDDAQWLDSDAVLFLRALLVQPEPVPGLLLLSHRSEHAEQSQPLLRVRDAVEGNSRLELRTLSVGPLPGSAAAALALRLLSESAIATQGAAAAIASESGGSPFFVGELCRFVARHGSHPSALECLSLPAALGDHLSVLPPLARRLLEHSALAGQPLPAQLLLEATQATHRELDLLRRSRLLRLSSLDGAQIVECYHDKVRETVAGSLTNLGRVGCYAALAAALEGGAYPDPELRAVCCEGAGQHAAAAEHYARAAAQALAGTAFLHAAELYEKVLALGRFSAERAQALSAARAQALSRAGRGRLAAEVFLRTAEGASARDKRALRRRAAVELLTAGFAEEGLALFRELFAELGLRLAATPGGALSRLVLSEVRLRLRGLEYTPREASSGSPERLEALELQYSSLMGLAMHAPPAISASVATDYLLRALSAGSASHVAVAVTCRAYFVAHQRPHADREITDLLELARRQASEVSDRLLVAGVESAFGMTSLARGHWKKAREHTVRSLGLLREVRAPSWMLDGTQYYLSAAGFLAGDWLELGSELPGQIEQGFSRDRIWIAVMLSGACGAAAWLPGDDAAGYERSLEQAKSRWRPGSYVLWPDYFLGYGETLLHLYRGEGERARRAIEPAFARARPLLARTQISHSIGLYTRGMTALMSLREAGDESLIAVVRDSAKGLSRLRMRFAPAMQGALEAGLALHARKPELGAARLRAVVAGFEENEMPLYAAAARRRLGELLGGDEGRALLAQGDAVLRAQRVQNLDAITEMLCAGCRAP